MFDDFVRRLFTADEPNRLWLTDIAEHATGEGKVYCSAIKDVYSNRIVVWIERTYRHRRPQDRLGGLTPIEFETKLNHTQAIAA